MAIAGLAAAAQAELEQVPVLVREDLNGKGLVAALVTTGFLNGTASTAAP
jgi:hypothetical protein